MGLGADTSIHQALEHAFHEAYLLGWEAVIRTTPVPVSLSSTWDPVGVDGVFPTTVSNAASD